MSELILTQDLTALVDRWLEAEQNGEKFPVPFDTAWQIAGYSRKDSAKRKLVKLSQGGDYHTSVEVVPRPQGGGTNAEVITLTCDAMKHFCLMAETEEGRQIRQYFIEAEKKWRLVKKVAPEVAGAVEHIQYQIELAKINAQTEASIALGKQADAQTRQAELAMLNLRHTITQTCPEPVQQKILGYQVIEKVEYRDRVFLGDQMLDDGSAATKTELCHRYGITTRTGKPDFRRLNMMLEDLRMAPEQASDAWDLSASIQESYRFKRRYLDQLDRLMIDGSRQRNLGE